MKCQRQHHHFINPSTPMKSSRTPVGLCDAEDSLKSTPRKNPNALPRPPHSNSFPKTAPLGQGAGEAGRRQGPAAPRQVPGRLVRHRAPHRPGRRPGRRRPPPRRSHNGLDGGGPVPGVYGRGEGTGDREGVLGRRGGGVRTQHPPTEGGSGGPTVGDQNWVPKKFGVSH